MARSLGLRVISSLGWELPDTVKLPDADRQFEILWTLNGRAVREASRVGLSLLARTQPALAQELGRRLSDDVPDASEDLRRATALFARILSYSQRDSSQHPRSGGRPNRSSRRRVTRVDRA